VITRPLPSGGYLNATKTALQKLVDEDALIRRMAGPGIQHAATRAAERRAAEHAAESERKARNPLAVLRKAHQLESEARAEADLLAPLVACAHGATKGDPRNQARRRDGAKIVTSRLQWKTLISTPSRHNMMESHLSFRVYLFRLIASKIFRDLAVSC
jgi:hypothetical protein